MSARSLRASGLAFLVAAACFLGCGGDPNTEKTRTVGQRQEMLPCPADGPTCDADQIAVCADGEWTCAYDDGPMSRAGCPNCRGWL